MSLWLTLLVWTLIRIPLRLIEARKAHKGVTAIPKIVPGEPGTTDAMVDTDASGGNAMVDDEKSSKRRRDEALGTEQDDEKAKRTKVKALAA